MDYLDPKKESRHRLILFTGYGLLVIAIVLATRLLYYQAYGFGVTREGAVIQNDLTFFSSKPNPANIYVNGELKNVRTNTRLLLPAGIYDVTLARDGYRDWKRKIELSGGSVEHFDYPFLFPKTLAPQKIQSYPVAPNLITQSPDRRWLLIQSSTTLTDFSVYDLKNPEEPPKTISLPPNLLTKAEGTWALSEWADDNDHVLLQHKYDDKTEYILASRSQPAESINLTNTLSPGTSVVSLINRKYDRYYLYDPAAQTLRRATLKEPAPVLVLEGVITYKTYSDDTVLYVTGNDAPAGKLWAKLSIGSKTYNIRILPTGTNYLLDLTKYDGAMYVVVGAGAENRVLIFKDPVGQLSRQPKRIAVSERVLRVEQPNYLSFSDNTQFIVTQNGNNFGVYDIENKKTYRYKTTEPIDAPQPNADWMDGNRLMYISDGKLIVFDYDNTNRQSLVAAGSVFMPAFSPDFKRLYTFTPGPTAPQFELLQTPLLVPADL